MQRRQRIVKAAHAVSLLFMIFLLCMIKIIIKPPIIIARNEAKKNKKIRGGLSLPLHLVETNKPTPPVQTIY